MPSMCFCETDSLDRKGLRYGAQDYARSTPGQAEAPSATVARLHDPERKRPSGVCIQEHISEPGGRDDIPQDQPGQDRENRAGALGRRPR